MLRPLRGGGELIECIGEKKAANEVEHERRTSSIHRSRTYAAFPRTAPNYPACEIRVTIAENDRSKLDVRAWQFTELTEGGEGWVPTKRGVAIKHPELVKFTGAVIEAAVAMCSPPNRKMLIHSLRALLDDIERGVENGGGDAQR